ncbi:MAG: sigma-70 family RNA polymerase sigma factor [Planctomycetes bacterium]|nr:sigma-70 family RNA polymerase sigma factor [Planctomycetota bacterium]
MVGDRDGDGVDPLHSGSPEAFDELIQSIGPASLLVVIESRMGRLLKERTTPEDIFQDALLIAWRDRRRCEWRGRRAFRTWFLTIVDHRIRDAVSYEEAQKRGGGESALSLSARMSGASDDSNASSLPLPIASTTPSRVAHYKEKAAAMREALEALPDDVRDVVRLRLFEQCTIGDIAVQLGIGSSAAEHRFYKGAALYQRLILSAMTSRGIPRNSARKDPPNVAPD